MPRFRARPLLSVLGVCAVALLTANCSRSPQTLATAAPSAGGGGIDPKYGVKASPRLYNEGDAIPKGGGRRFSGKPYVVAGRTYVPREEAGGYVREGLASWYGSAFHGRMTANGEVFDRHSIAAAHPTLPLPSYARVTNLKNGYSMVVRVNDRGPYHANRVMDVSEEVARALDFHRKGTERVRVEYVGKASVAGSDDRRLMATLRTDGRPTDSSRSSIMVADLGPDAAPRDPERFARPAQPAFAFKPAEERGRAIEQDRQPAGEPMQRRRPAPVLLAQAPAVPVQQSVLSSAGRPAAFRPPVSAGTIARSDARSAPLNLAPPPVRLAAAVQERSSAVPANNPREGRMAEQAFGARGVSSNGSALRGGSARPELGPSPATRLASARLSPAGENAPSHAGRPAAKVAASAMPNDAKAAMAKLAAASAAPAAKVNAPAKRAHMAGVY